MTQIETNRAKIVRRLGEEGWRLTRFGAEHDIYVHEIKPGVLAVPRHRTLSSGVARQIAKTAGWR
ncbi:MAG: type II toxin-antitoxin system HicA family toxin [Roseiarcus sp.]